MRKYIFLLFLFITHDVFAQSIPASADSALNTLKVKKTVYSDISITKPDIAPEHIDAISVKLYRKELFLFSFTPASKSTGDSAMLKKNPAYLHYALGQHSNRRAFYYQGKFETLPVHHSWLEREQLGLDTCFTYFDTAVMVATRNHRYLFTKWLPDQPKDTGYHSLIVLFIFNKNNKLLKHLAYDNPGMHLTTSIGFFNRDELLDIIFYEGKTQDGGKQYCNFSLYSLDKKGRFKKRKFHKGEHRVAIPVT